MLFLRALNANFFAPAIIFKLGILELFFWQQKIKTIIWCPSLSNQLREGGVVVLFGRSRPRLNWLFPSCQCPFKGHETAWPTFNWNIDLKEETEMIELKKAFTSIITLKIHPVFKTLIFLIILKTLTLLRTLHNFWQWKQLILRHLSRVRYISGNVLG